MPGIEDQPPTENEVANVRQKFQDYILENGKECFDEFDIKRVMTEDFYIHRWFMHVFDMPGDQIDTCTNNMIKALRWRKDENIRGINSDTLSPTLKERGSLYLRNKDKDGWPLLVFAVRKHTKGIESPELMKQHFLYYMDRIDRMTNGGQLSIVFECKSCGLKNLDMDFVFYMIQCLIDYFPYCLSYILVIDMPWILNAAWKIIKGWLPAAGVKKIKFLTKSNLGEYIPEDQQLVIWGGKDTWEYEFIEEDTSKNVSAMTKCPSNSAYVAHDTNNLLEHRPKSLHLVNGDSSEAPPPYIHATGDTEGRKKSVTFASNSPSPSTISFTSQQSPTSRAIPIPGSSMTEAEHQPISSSPNSGNKAGSTPPQANTPPPSLNSSFNIGNTNTPNRNLLGLTPSDEVVFDVNNAGENNGLQAKLQIKNNSNKMVVFKIKTTSPEKYRVRPSASYIKANGSCDVEIHVHQSQLNDDQPGNNAVAVANSSIISPEVSASLMKDKFLVTAITLEEDADENPSQSKLNELLKNNRPESQYRLRCSLTGTQFKSTQNNRLQSGSGKEISPTSSTLASANKQLENLSKKVNELKQTVNESAETITSLKKTTLIMLGIIMFLQLVLAYQVISLNSESGNVTNSGDIINHQETHISDEKQEL